MIRLDLVKGVYYLNFYPKPVYEGKTYYFSIWIMTKGAKDGKKYPMSLTVNSNFDPSKVPFTFDGSANEFTMDFQFAVGPNRVYTRVKALTQTTFGQEITIMNDNKITDLDIGYIYTDKLYTTVFSDPEDSKVKA